MQTNNLLPVLFHEATVRVGRREDGKVLFALVDIAQAIPHDIRGIRRILTNSSRLFRRRFGVLKTLNSSGGPSEIQALTRDGIVALLTKISPSRIKDPERAERVAELQDLIVDIADAVLSGELVMIPREEAERHGFVATGKPLVKNVEGIRRLALRPRYEHGYAEEIKALAEAEGKEIGSIYHYIRRYREAGELGLQRQPIPGQRKGYGPYIPEDYEKVRQYFKEHPSDTAKAVRRNSGTGLKHWTVKRMLRNLRRGT